MYLKKSHNRKTGRTQLFIVEAYRDNEKRPKAKVIKTLGYLDVLEKQYDDPIKYFSDMAREMTAKRKKDLSDILGSADHECDGRLEFPERINFGFAALLKLCSILKLTEFLSEFNRSTKSDYHNSTMLTINICGRLLFDFSEPDALRSLARLFGGLKFTTADFYRAVDLISKQSREIAKIMSCGLSSFYSFDKYRLFLLSELTPYKFAFRSDPFADDFFGRYSCKSCYGLITDGNGLPFDFRFLKKRLRDTDPVDMLHLDKPLPEDHENLKTLIVSGNIHEERESVIRRIILNGHGYLLGFPLSYADEDLKKWALDKKDYSTDLRSGCMHISDTNRPASVTAFAEDIRNGRFSFKERVVEKIIENNGSRHFYSEKQIIIYSPTYADMERNHTSMTGPDSVSGYSFEGYAVIVTSETGLDLLKAGEIFSYYEEMTYFFDFYGNMDTRPSAKTGLNNHRAMDENSEFLLNLMSFTLIKLLSRMTDTGYSLSDMIESLKKCEYIHVRDDIYILAYSDSLLSKLGQSLHLDLTKKFRNFNEIKKLIRSLAVT